jgi:hypoxanthine phosphoribosyltransferase
MRILTWDDFDEAVYRIANMFEGRAFNGIYGFPRGGLCLAVALSHHLNLPLLNELEPDCLVVDDIYETGQTLEPVQEVVGCEAVVWVTKATPSWFRAVLVEPGPEWVLFPWETPANANTDEEAYRASRE